ncbi:Srm, partial [Symbiodinium sp. KB8]
RIQDAAEYIANHKNSFDVVIVDSSDPIGPAETLFTTKFYEDLRDALTPTGIVCTQGECQWLHLKLIDEVLSNAQTLFPTVDYAYTTIPTYPSGQIGYILCSRRAGGKERECLASIACLLPLPGVKLLLRPPQIHKAAFVLPEFTQRALDHVRPRAYAAIESCPAKQKGRWAGHLLAAAAVGAVAAVGIMKAFSR